MWCMKCNRELTECVCSDLAQRLESIKKCKHVYVAPDQMNKYEEQAEKHKDDKTVQE